jgi:GWxTD domain-containing protein
VRAEFEVPDYSKSRFGFGDLVLGVVDTTGAFRPVPAREFGINVRRFAVQATLFDRREGEWPRSYPFRFRILDDQGETILSGRRDVSVPGSGVPVVVTPDSSDLFIGSYVFEIELVEGKSRWRADRSFVVEESGPPRGRDFERLLEPLAYIAEAGEIEHLSSLPVEEQGKGWTAFWRRRDPTPETDRNEALLEFFRRLRYAEQRFQSFGPGWRSDMGRIYIKFGPPDQTESRSATTDTPQLEVWYYNRPYRRFVFADREGFGRFVLLSPALE